MLERISNTVKQHFILIGILVLATVLRCYDLFSIPFTHDEISGLVRTEFNSFSDLINKGVKIDGHPALIQVFLYYWTGIFGSAEWIVKLPFILSGLGAVFLGYKIGKRWSNETTGLIVAAILASSQYPIMYSQIARPYITGLFFTLLLAYHWGELVFFKRREIKHQIYFAVAAALCAYNHHFSLLAAALIAIVGFSLISRDFILRYFLLCLSAVVLYSPHFGIFFAQLKMGGLSGWLGEPELNFIPHYFKYIFHYSNLVLGTCVLIIALTLFIGKRTEIRLKPLLLSFFMFFGVLAIGFVYSIKVAPVLQPSVLIFVYPFLLVFLFGWAKQQSNLVNTFIVLFLVLVNCYALIFTRKHYSVFYEGEYKEMILDANDHSKTYPSMLTILFTDEAKTRYYERNYGLNIPANYIFIQSPEWTDKDFEELLDKHYSTADQVCLGGASSIPPNFRAILLSKYPRIILQKNYFLASTLIAGKGKPSEKPLVDLFEQPQFFSGYNPSNNQNGGYVFHQNEEWGPMFSQRMSDLTNKHSDFVDVVVKLKLSDLNQQALICMNIQSNDSTIHYSDNGVKSHTVNRKDSTVTLVQSIRLIDIKYEQFDTPIFNAYLWNVDKKPMSVLLFQVIRRKGNPRIYGLLEPFED